MLNSRLYSKKAADSPPGSSFLWLVMTSFAFLIAWDAASLVRATRLLPLVLPLLSLISAAAPAPSSSLFSPLSIATVESSIAVVGYSELLLRLRLFRRSKCAACANDEGALEDEDPATKTDGQQQRNRTFSSNHAHERCALRLLRNRSLRANAKAITARKAMLTKTTAVASATSTPASSPASRADDTGGATIGAGVGEEDASASPRRSR